MKLGSSPDQVIVCSQSDRHQPDGERDSQPESWSTSLGDWPQIHSHILELERQGLVTRTFRRLDPERQLAVIQAILDEAIARGPAGLSVKEVANRAGVSVGSLYTYFPKREGLLAFAVQLSTRYMADLFTIYSPELAAMPLKQAIPAFIVSGMEWSQVEAGLTQFFARAAYQGESPLTDEVVRPVAVAMRGMVRDMLAAAAARGEIRPDLDLDAMSRVVYVLTVAVADSQLLPYLNAYFQVTGDAVSPERAMAAMMELIMKGIGQ